MSTRRASEKAKRFNKEEVEIRGLTFREALSSRARNSKTRKALCRGSSGDLRIPALCQARQQVLNIHLEKSMLSITLAAVAATALCLLFTSTRALGAIGVFVLVALSPAVFGTLLLLAGVAYLFYNKRRKLWGDAKAGAPSTQRQARCSLTPPGAWRIWRDWAACRRRPEPPQTCQIRQPRRGDPWWQVASSRRSAGGAAGRATASPLRKCDSRSRLE